MFEQIPPIDETALNDAWDRLVQSSDELSDEARLDAEIAESLRRIQILGATPPPRASSLRVQDGVRAALSLHDSAGTRALLNGSIGASDAPAWADPDSPAVVPLVRPNPAQARTRRAAFLALAAVVIIALGLAFVRLGPDRWGNHQRKTIPAAIAPAAPTPDQSSKDLLSLRIPAAIVPRGEQTWGGLNVIDMPGGTSEWAAYRGVDNPGLRFDYVLTGNYSVAVDGEATLLRAGAATAETVPAGTEVTLESGDAMTFANEVGARYNNPGTAPVRMLFWILFDSTTGGYSSDPIPGGWRILDLDLQADELTVPDDPVSLNLRQVLLSQRETFPAPPPDVIRFRVAISAENASGTPMPVTGYQLLRLNDGSFQTSSHSVSAVVLTLESDYEERRSPTP